jgi:hypothetical protein
VATATNKAQASDPALASTLAFCPRCALAQPIVPSPVPCRIQRGRGSRTQILVDPPGLLHRTAERRSPSQRWQHTDAAGPVPHVSSSRRAIPAAARQHSYVYVQVNTMRALTMGTWNADAGAAVMPWAEGLARRRTSRTDVYGCADTGPFVCAHLARHAGDHA